MPTIPPWKVYEEELHSKGYGIPLWVPEPSNDVGVQIGDVGFLLDGEFRSVLNARDGTAYSGWRLPDNFEPFSFFPQLAPPRPRWIPANQAVYSAGITSASASADARVGDMGGISFDFQSTRERGALLFVRGDATRESVMAHKKMAKYMAKNVESWRSVMEDATGSFPVEDIIFIRGHVKTTAWGVASLTAGHSRQAVSISGGYGPASAGVHVTHDTSNIASLDQRWGPLDPKHDKTDQCLFVNYYRYKRRLFWTSLQAGAGPDTLPDGENSGSDDEVVAVDDASNPPSRDPVIHLLDYILKYKEEATCAVACDGDITELTRGGEWPENMRDYLTALMPEIEVIDGVGMLDMAKAVYRSHFGSPMANDLTENIRDEVQSGPEAVLSVVTHAQTEAGPPSTAHADAEAGPSGTAHADEDVTMDQHDSNEPQNEAAVQLDSVVTGAGETAVADEDTVRQSKAMSATSVSVLGSITMGGRTTEWPHRHLVDPNDTASFASVTSFHVAPDAKYVAVGYADGQVRLWSSQGWGSKLRISGHHEDPVNVLKFSPDGRFLVTASTCAYVWDVGAAQDGHYHQTCQLEGIVDLVWDVDWSPDGKVIATGSSDYLTRMSDASNGTVIRSMEDTNMPVSALRFTADGNFLVSTSSNSAYIYNAHSGELLGITDGHTSNICCLDLSPDSKRLVTGSDDGSHRIYNIENGEELVVFHAHKMPIWVVAFSPDGKNVMAGSYDSRVTICDSYSSTRLHELRGQDLTITAGSYSRQGHFVAIGYNGGSLKLWDAEKGASICDLMGHEENISGLQFSSNDDFFVTSSDEGSVRIWSISDILRIYEG